MAQVIFDTIERDRDYLREWLPFVNATKHVSDTTAFIKSVVENEPQINSVYSIWYKEEFAGLIGFKDIDRINKKTEIGYWLSEKMQHKGIVSLSTRKLIKYAFKSLKLNRIQIKVATDNTRSEAIPIRLGFAFEGIEREGELHGEKYQDLKVYSLTKSDNWQ